jgi:two-component system response regulator AdeR
MSPESAVANAGCPLDEGTTILFVDSDVALLNTYERLCGPGCTVLTARAGESALDQFGDHVDFAFFDRYLPDMSGEEAIRALRERGYETPVGIISASIPEEKLSADHLVYAIKPVTRDELFRIVGQHT